MKINNIVCPVDFSTLSDAAIDHASTLARRHGAVLHFIHVYEPVFADGYIEGMPVQPPPADVESLRGQLQAIRPTCETTGYHHELIFGFPGGSIVGYAQTHQADLIVMGTHGRSGPSRLIMGSVAETVMRAASCPVLVVHESKNSSPAT